MWKKKLKEYKGKFKNYSIRKKLNYEKKINSNFEVILNSFSTTRTPKDAATVLGITERQLREEIDKFQIKPEDCNYELPDDTN